MGSSRHLGDIGAHAIDTEIEDRVRDLACLGAALALGAPRSMLGWLSGRARQDGATVDEIIGTLLVAAPMIGKAGLVGVAPDLAMAIGYDVDLALETLD